MQVWVADLRASRPLFCVEHYATFAEVPASAKAEVYTLIADNLIEAKCEAPGWTARKSRATDLKGATVVLLRDAGKLVGLIAWRFVCDAQSDSVPVSYVFELQLAQGARQSGNGSLLLDTATRVARVGTLGKRARKIAGVMLSSYIINTKANGFYEHAGFGVRSRCETYHVYARMFDDPAAQQQLVVQRELASPMLALQRRSPPAAVSAPYVLTVPSVPAYQHERVVSNTTLLRERWEAQALASEMVTASQDAAARADRAERQAASAVADRAQLAGKLAAESARADSAEDMAVISCTSCNKLQ